MLTIPGSCWLCRMPLALAHWGICSRCSNSLKPARCCPQCGLPAALTHLPCGRCLQKPPPWQRLIYVSDYCAPLSQLIHQLKFQRQTALAQALARLLLLQIRAAKSAAQLPPADGLIGVPLHQRRAWRRGFNQSTLIARPLARWMGLPCQDNLITRIRAGGVQHQLSAQQRRRNLKRSFQLELPVRDRHMVIVDDVVTTGSTVAEIARLLTRQGAATVQVWCLCRTL